MAHSKGQSDGIRKRGKNTRDHTISLAPKKVEEPAERTVSFPAASARAEEQAKKQAPRALPAKEPARTSTHELARDYTVVEPVKAVRPESERTLPASEHRAEIPAPESAEDKVSSWFSKKKAEEPPKEDDFYTGIGFSEEEREKTKRRGAFFWGAAIGGAALIMIIAFSSTVFARATITLKPTTETVELRDVVVSFDTSVGEVLVRQRAVPAARFDLTKTVTEEFESTGKKTADFKARGTARIYNAFNSSPQTLVANTRFLTGDGALYRLIKQVTVPGAKVENGAIIPRFIEAEIVADQPGSGGNRTGEVRLSIPGFQGTSRYEKFYAIAPTGFTGGASGEQRVVTADDQKRASEAVTKRIYEELEKESFEKVPPEFLVTDALRSVEITKLEAPAVDTVAERFSVRADAVARVMVFRERDVLELLRTLVVGDGAPREIIPERASILYTARSVDYTRGRAAVVLGGSVEVRAVIPESDVRSIAVGRRVEEVRASLDGRDDIASVEISVFPFWLFSVPSDTGKIYIRYE